MSTVNLQKEWRNIAKEIHDKPKCQTPYPKEIVFMRRLLLFAQIFLEKVGDKNNVPFNSELYQKVMAEYYRQKSSINLK